MPISTPQEFLNFVEDENSSFTEELRHYIENASPDELNFIDPHTNDTALIHAACNGNLEIVKCLIDHGANINLSGDSNYTPLIIATEFNNMEIAELLLQHGASVNNETMNKNTALIYAAKNNNLKVVELLLQRNANPNTRSVTNHTPLMYAAENSNNDIAKLLLNAEADVNYHSEEFDTPLIWAVKTDNIELTKLLLQKHADVDFVNNENHNVLTYAAKNNNEEIVQLLISHGAKDHDGDEEEKKTALQYAIEHNNTNMAKMLVDNGSTVNLEIVRPLQERLLSIAVQKDNHAMVTLLIKNGINKKQQDEILSYLILKNNTQMLQTFLNAGIEQSSINKAFLSAVEQKKTSSVELLIERIDLTDKALIAQILPSVTESNIDILRLLIKAGINEDFKRNALILAAENMEPKSVRLLLENTTPESQRNLLYNLINKDDLISLETLINGGINDDTKTEALNLAVENKKVKSVRILLKNTDLQSQRKIAANVINTDKLESLETLIKGGMNETIKKELLHYAAEERKVNAVKLLLENTTKKSHSEILSYSIRDNNSQMLHSFIEAGINNETKTILFNEAVEGNNIDAVRLLAQNGVDVNVSYSVDNGATSYTPLTHAVRNNNLQMVNLLLENGADPIFSNVDGTTALNWCYNNENPQIKDRLVLAEALAYFVDPPEEHQNISSISASPSRAAKRNNESPERVDESNKRRRER